jgi:hypothetical protein
LPDASRPKLDFSRINFPSDQVTVKSVRQALARKGDDFDRMLLAIDTDNWPLSELKSCLWTERG